jgi:glycosyltransferase involved in cell wall biosynthesis
VYQIGICGHFGRGKKLFDGQTVKTKILTEELIKKLGSDNIRIIDTHGWKSNPISFLIKCYQLIKVCKNIIILPAQNGIKVFVPLLLILNKLFHRKLHYVVIGGWLPELLKKNNSLRKKLTKFYGIYVETDSMVKSLKNIGLNNVRRLPNFKRLEILEESELVYSTGEPYKLCTFSRVVKEKGIEDAIDVVKSVNEALGRTVYTLDIYGQIDEKYSGRFEELRKKFPFYISYKGIVNFNDSVKVLKNYFALLFPTYYKGEGFAGTILDAFASGLPVIATNWKYNGEIIQNKLEGFLYDYKTNNLLKDILFEIAKKPSIIIKMKKNCLKKAKNYSPEIVIGDFLKYLA